MTVLTPYITGLYLNGVRAHLASRDLVEVERVDGWHRVVTVSCPGQEDGLTLVTLDDGPPLILPEPWYHERARTYRVTERDRSVEISRWDRVMDRLADQDCP